MWDLLEHLADPVLAINKVHEVLGESGLFILEIPVRDSLLHWVAKLVYKFSLGKVKRPLFLTYGIHHLQYFSTKSINNILIQNGFSIVKC
ncbi:MAG: methyltransferase domain-containing protein, partial [Mariprofundales bacterium]